MGGAVPDPRLERAGPRLHHSIPVVEHRYLGRRPLGRADRRPGRPQAVVADQRHYLRSRLSAERFRSLDPHAEHLALLHRARDRRRVSGCGHFGRRLCATPTARDDDNGDLHRGAARRVYRRADRGPAAALLRLAGHFYPWRRIPAGARSGAGAVAAGIAALSRPQKRSVAAAIGVARTPRYRRRAERAARRRCRPGKPGQDAVRRGLRAADGAALGDFLLQSDEPVSVRLLAAGGLASDRDDAGYCSVCLELAGPGRDFRGCLPRPADRPCRS